MYLARPTYCCCSRLPGRGECGIPEGFAVNTYVPTSTTTYLNMAPQMAPFFSLLIFLLVIRNAMKLLKSFL